MRITQRTASVRTAALRAACAVALAFTAQQAAAQPPAAAGKMVVYRTQAGDTLYDVAARYLQGADDWQLLQQINGVPAPKHLQPGVALKLPVARLRKEKLTARVIAVQGTAERASGAAFAPLATSSGAVGAPVQLLGAPSLAHPDKVQDEPDVAFDVAPLPQAQAYRVQLAHDAGLLDLFRETRTDSPRAVFRDVPNGNYFVRIAAIDANGLEGLPRTYAFERRVMGLDASASQGAGGYEFRWSPNGSGKGARYRFVLSRSKDLSAPVVDQVGLHARQITVAHLPPGDYFWAVTVEEFEGGKFYEKTSPVSAFTLSR